MRVFERSTISFTLLHTLMITYYTHTHLKELHACNFKIAYFELFKNSPPPIPLKMVLQNIKYKCL